MWHAGGTPVRTTASCTQSRWHQLVRWMRPVHGYTSLVGKLRSSSAAGAAGKAPGLRQFARSASPPVARRAVWGGCERLAV
jgi:hypothetical protein